MVFDVLTAERLRSWTRRALVNIGSDADGARCLSRTTRGNTVFAAFADEAGRGMTRHSDENGSASITLGTDTDGGRSRSTTRTPTQYAMGVETDGTGYFALYDAEGMPRLAQSVDADGGVFTIFNVASTPVIQMYADEKRAGCLRSTARSRAPKGSSSGPTSTAARSLYNADGINALWAYVSEEGGAS